MVEFVQTKERRSRANVNVITKEKRVKVEWNEISIILRGKHKKIKNENFVYLVLSYKTVAICHDLLASAQ
jgi:hypothetical protein